MDKITQYLNKISYKFPKGYPDVNDPKDMETLMEMVSEFTLQENSGGSATYDDTIRFTLFGKDYKDKEIPKPSKKYPYNQNTFTVKVDGKDKEIFDKLYPAKPPKVGKEVGSAGSLGVGNGEIALYWLYQFSDSANVEEGRDGDDPDLFFNGQGVEVKSWSKHSGLHGLGRFGADKENLALLSLIFGLSALVSVLEDGKAPAKTINPTNFRGPQLVSAMEQVKEFKDLLDQNGSLADEYPLFKNVKTNVDKIYSSLDISDGDSATEMARKMAIKLLQPKLSRKPGDGNHLANVKDDGDIKFFQIDFDKLKDSEDLLNDFVVKQSAININFEKIWG